ncbi:hypothetical protein PM082_000171 [Marasmius tenuissimus]|nr:hypothetical protein PM082_000171 [Marasmius tenuissimus]
MQQHSRISSSGISLFAGSQRHHRSQTEIQTLTSDSGQHHHPLRTAAISDTLADTGVTRPHLHRVLTSGPTEVVGTEEIAGNADEEVEAAEEKAVLVHRVEQRDSLAGVALKYGITITELRRANQLWSSDSIHLRKELYIPLDKASRCQVDTTSQEALIPPSSPRERNRNTLIDDTVPEDPSRATIRKIPTKNLSFFPPSAKTIGKAPAGRTSLDLPSESGQQPWTAITPSSSLNTFLTALPIPTSTKDSIMARLSFESANSSYSDREHELDDVRASRHARSLSHDSVLDGLDNTPIPRRTRPGVLRKVHGRPGSSNINMEDLSRRDNSVYPMTSPDRVSTSPDITSPIPVRTVQLEPSPTMHLPTPRKEVRSKTLGANTTRRGKSRRKLIDVGFDSDDHLSASGDG